MALVYNGKRVATNNPQITISRQEYDSLPPEVKNDPNNTFFIHDDNVSDHEKLVTMSTVIGSAEWLENYADGTVIGAIKDLYTRLGGLSFKIDPEFNHVQATYSDEVPNNEIQQLAEDATLEEQIAYLSTIIGDTSGLAETGYDNVVGAIIDMYARLNSLTFAFNNDTGTVEVTDTL